MADYPALPLWTDAYIADTMHMSCLESGAYLHLLMAAWRSPDCALPDDDAKLCRMARCTPREWRKVRDVVMAFWIPLDDGNTSPASGGFTKWTQKRLLRERDFVRAKSEKAKHAANAKWLKDNETDDADASPGHTVEHSVGTCSGDAPDMPPTPTPTPIKKTKDWDADFEVWYAAYPRKVARGAALKAYRAARQKVDQSVLLAGLERYKRDKPETIAWCYPATWLNGERWADDPQGSDDVPKPQPRPECIMVWSGDCDWAQLARRMKGHGYRVDVPDAPGECRGPLPPPHLIPQIEKVAESFGVRFGVREIQ